MTQSEQRPARRRRRAQRPSTAENYDRSFDAPTAGARTTESDGGEDELRSVSFDEAAAVGGDDEPTGEAFYRENMPPHFGSTQ
ncbi:hypothetical protein [uncultured Corynebacterium sp.]|uniref:hypothetical protein n=1 Tax=uncultured Corynebacterium sp. TaxID=159447 RepID=UPI0025E65DDD|nr:hypothetical protein [uncultured Corynebacterium sp.]